jgi:hypothetical protein
MFLLYHSEGYNIYEIEFHKCYINNLRTTTCSGMLGHRKYKEGASHLVEVQDLVVSWL